MRSYYKRISIVVSLLLIAAGSSFAQTYPIDTIYMNGPADKRMNFVFVSDGFKITEMANFRAGVKSITDQLFATVPYKNYRNYINVFAVEVPSTESGANHPKTAFDCPPTSVVTVVDNIFGSTFDYGGIHRLLVPTKESDVTTVLFDNFPDYRQAFVLVNSAEYGGSGGSLATASMETSSGEIAIHEIGHSLAILGDEYGGGTPASASEKPNTTATTTRANIRWNKWILPTTPIPTDPSFKSVIGLFEGAAYSDVGWFRPKADCKMRDLGVPFCSVCAEAITDTIVADVAALDGFSPTSSSASPITLNATDSVTLHLALVKPSPNSLSVIWKLNGTTISTNSDSLVLNAASLTNGANSLFASITDTTVLARAPRPTFRTFLAQWHLKKLPAGVESSTDPTSFAFTASSDLTVAQINATLSLPKPEHVLIVLNDLAGREIKTLFDGELGVGNQSLHLPTGGLLSGAYAVQCKAGDVTVGRVVVITR